jgi:uncharacterized protein YuzE
LIGLLRGKVMKVHYYQETDSLYIDLSPKEGVDPREVAPGVVLDLDAAGQVWALILTMPARSLISRSWKQKLYL